MKITTTMATDVHSFCRDLKSGLPMCLRLCLARFDGSLVLQSQSSTSHPNGFPLLCCCMCLRKFAFTALEYENALHWNGFSFECFSSLCVAKSDPEEYSLATLDVTFLWFFTAVRNHVPCQCGFVSGVEAALVTNHPSPSCRCIRTRSVLDRI